MSAALVANKRIHYGTSYIRVCTATIMLLNDRLMAHQVYGQNNLKYYPSAPMYSLALYEKVDTPEQWHCDRWSGGARHDARWLSCRIYWKKKHVAKVTFGQGRIEPSPLAVEGGHPHLIQCFLGPKKSPPQTGRRSVQPFLHSLPVWQTDRRRDHRSQ